MTMKVKVKENKIKEKTSGSLHPTSRVSPQRKKRKVPPLSIVHTMEAGCARENRFWKGHADGAIAFTCDGVRGAPTHHSNTTGKQVTRQVKSTKYQGRRYYSWSLTSRRVRGGGCERPVRGRNKGTSHFLRLHLSGRVREMEKGKSVIVGL